MKPILQPIIFLTLLCLLLTSCQFSLAYVPEEFYQIPRQLPPSVKEALPEGLTFIRAERTGESLGALFQENASSFKVYIYHAQGTAYVLDCISAPLPKLGTTPNIGVAGADTLYLMYQENHPWYCATFKRTLQGKWQLCTVQTSHDWYYFYDGGLCGYIDGCKHYLPGKVDLNLDLAAIDAASIPATLFEAAKLVDTTGWAMIALDKKTPFLTLYSEPGETAASLGQYVQGVPVQILEDLGQWVRVSIGEREGYLKAAFLVKGEAMLNISSKTFEKCIIEGKMEEGVALHALPSINSPVLGHLSDSDLFYWVRILGIADDEWYHILQDDGQSGYAQMKYFWDGNG